MTSSFFTLLTICKNILTNTITSIPDVLSTFTSSLGDSIYDALSLFYEFPLIGIALSDIATALTEPLKNVTLLNFMFGALIPVMVVYSFVKWLVGIVTGS